MKHCITILFLLSLIYSDDSLREIRFHLRTGFPDKVIYADEILLNGVRINDRSYIETGDHHIVVKKSAYETISEKITVVPSLQPYIFERIFSPAPRKVVKKILATFPKMQIIPKVCTLNKIPVDGRYFKPGNYILNIEHPGYQSIDKAITINPAETTYLISEFLDPKDVKIVINITYDVLPERKMQYRIYLKNEVARVVIQNGRFIKPESYIYEIVRPGYDIAADRMLIMPRETPYVIECCLVARKRSVVINTVDDNGDVIVPDKITIGSQLVVNGYKIKPGNYELTIKKSGYKTLVKNIVILADDMDFVIEEKLQQR